MLRSMPRRGEQRDISAGHVGHAGHVGLWATKQRFACLVRDGYVKPGVQFLKSL